MSHRPTVYGTRHAVSAGHYLAAAAGFSVLESGGNAIDAGVAAGIALGVLQPDRLSFGPVAARHAYSLQSVGRAGAVFQLSASLFAEAVTLAVCFAGDDANEAIVNRFLDWYEAELPG